ncbi:hypothetical protein NLU13_1683 [Sarocladium strictum]|uniref:Myb-like domain-containing protein n=1 Tax=Sarocladium strictum TaxID=5046 RepID=A0AA39GRE6_SARSR|nr:hypothetical protein NLU13_1683 [Sarocladium strictum]
MTSEPNITPPNQVAPVVREPAVISVIERPLGVSNGIFSASYLLTMSRPSDSGSDSDSGPGSAHVDFHVSMTDFILGRNPVTVTEAISEGDPSPDGRSSESSEAVSTETSESAEDGTSAESEPNEVVLTPVEDSSSKDSEASDIECEKMKPKEEQENGESSSDCALSSVDTLVSWACEEAHKSHQQEVHIVGPDGDKDTSETVGEESIAEETTEKTGTASTSWSISEDALLRGLKEGGETWAEIAKAMQRSKSDVKARWKVVQKQPRPADSDEEETRPKEKAKHDKNKSQGGKVNDKDGSKDEKEKEGNSTTTKEAEGKGKQTCGQKKTQGQASPAASNSTQSCHSSLNDLEEQRTYLRSTIRPALYPKRITLKPDVAFSASDCDVLESVDAQHHRGRWLEMQANFYNATGRFIPLHCIRDKFQRAERERLSQVMGDNCAKEDSVEKVLRWIDGVDA